MAKLLGTESDGVLTDKYWLHTGDDGKDRITVETIQDVEPVFKKVRETSETFKGQDMRYLGSVPVNLVNELSKKCAQQWGCSVREAFSEIISNKTDRAKAIWKMLLQDRDYRKLQADNHGTKYI